MKINLSLLALSMLLLSGCAMKELRAFVVTDTTSQKSLKTFQGSSVETESDSLEVIEDIENEYSRSMAIVNREYKKQMLSAETELMRNLVNPETDALQNSPQ